MLLSQNIEVFRGSQAILKNLSISLCPGEFIALLGPSGAGKSTLLKTMAGLIKPDRGAVSLEQKELTEWNSVLLARKLALVPQDDILHTGLSVLQALTYGAQLRLPVDKTEAEISAQVQRVLKQTGMTEHQSKKIKRLSGGQRKRVNVGMELISSPDYLFLDEPTSGLDPALEEQMMALFRNLAKAGQGVVTSTHAMGSLDLVDFVAIVCDGLLVSFAPLGQTLKYYGVSHIAEVFKKLRTQQAEQWHRQFKNSAMAPVAAKKRRSSPKAGQAMLDQMSELVAMTTPRTQSAPASTSQSAPASVAPKAATQQTPTKKAAADDVADLLAELAQEVEQEKGRGA